MSPPEALLPFPSEEHWVAVPDGWFPFAFQIEREIHWATSMCTIAEAGALFEESLERFEVGPLPPLT